MESHSGLNRIKFNKSVVALLRMQLPIKRLIFLLYELSGKNYFITGATRGIGKDHPLRLAKEGANIIVRPNRLLKMKNLAALFFNRRRNRSSRRKAHPVQCDIHFEDQIKHAVEEGISKFGGIDMVINSICHIIDQYRKTEPKRFDLMHDINVRGTFFVVQTCLPF